MLARHRRYAYNKSIIVIWVQVKRERKEILYGKTVYAACCHRAGGGHGHRLRRVLQGGGGADKDRRQSVRGHSGFHYYGRGDDHQRLHLRRGGPEPSGRGGAGGLRPGLLRKDLRLLCGMVHGGHLLPLAGGGAQLAARPLFRRADGLGGCGDRRPHHDAGGGVHDRHLHHERAGPAAGGAVCHHHHRHQADPAAADGRGGYYRRTRQRYDQLQLHPRGDGDPLRGRTVRRSGVAGLRL